MDVGPLRLQHAIQFWHMSGGVAVLEKPLEPGPWMETVATALLPVLLATGGCEVRHRTQTWELDLAGPQVELVPSLALPSSVHTAVFPTPEERVALSALWYWRQRGTQQFWFCELDGWRQVDAEAALARRLYGRIFRRIVDRILPLLRINHQPAEEKFVQWMVQRRGRRHAGDVWHRLAPDNGIACWREWIERDNQAHDGDAGLPTDRPRVVTQYIGSLFSGGAERQLCNVSLGLARRGVGVQVLTGLEPIGAQGHYAGLLRDGGVPVRQAAAARAWIEQPWLPVQLTLLQATPQLIRHHIFRLRAELAEQRPDILHCWLDHPNIVGGVAGLLAGVPRILLSTRNYNPTHFPRLVEPYMQAWYRLLAASRRVHFLANSHAGAASYAEWIGIPIERIHVVLNGVCFDHFQEPTVERRLAARQLFGLQPNHRVLCGIFRLDVEKQPELFLEVARRLAGRIPNLRVLLAGTGPLEPPMRAGIKQYRLTNIIQLLGRRQDVEQVLLASDVMLLTSSHEGCPNVALEAQYFGVPVVATATGGTPDVVADGRTGLLAGVSDVTALADHTARLLEDADLRGRFSREARSFITQAFSLDQMIDLTELVYRQLLAPAARRMRVVTPRPAWLDEKCRLSEHSPRAA